MDQKNVIAAIALSSAIIVLWSLFMVPDQPTKEQILAERKKIENTETPKIEKKEIIKKIPREESINSSERIIFENDNIIGSISLTNGGATPYTVRVIASQSFSDTQSDTTPDANSTFHTKSFY